MAELPILSPSMFNALNLTDEQKQQMDKIKKELESEFEQTIENYATGRLFMEKRVLDEFEKEGITNKDLMAEGVAAVMKKEGEMRRKLMESDPEFKKIYEEIQSRGKLFSTKLKMKMFDVLTDDQWERLQKLVDSPPGYAQMLGKKWREWMGESEKTEAWQPGVHSWKPGDAIPEEYRQERNKRRQFPKQE
jgi:Ni/Co efflux regulator RcnB